MIACSTLQSAVRQKYTNYGSIYSEKFTEQAQF